MISEVEYPAIEKEIVSFFRSIYCNQSELRFYYEQYPI